VSHTRSLINYHSSSQYWYSASASILGVTFTCSLSASDHIRGVISDCAQTQYALRVLRSHGLNTAGLRTVFQSVVVSKLLYASPAWSGFTSAADRQRVYAFLRRSKRCGLRPPDLMTFEQLLEEADQQLFNKLCNNTDHCLRSLLPPPSTASQHYQLCQSAHNRDIPERTRHLTDSNFLTRLIHKHT